MYEAVNILRLTWLSHFFCATNTSWVTRAVFVTKCFINKKSTCSLHFCLNASITGHFLVLSTKGYCFTSQQGSFQKQKWKIGTSYQTNRGHCWGLKKVKHVKPYNYLWRLLAVSFIWQGCPAIDTMWTPCPTRKPRLSPMMETMVPPVRGAVVGETWNHVNTQTFLWTQYSAVHRIHWYTPYIKWSLLNRKINFDSVTV